MKFSIEQKKKVYDGKYLSVWHTDFFDKKGQKKIWEWVERKNSVFIFPITKNQKAVLIKNYRIPLESYVIEMPAGLMDNPKENDIETARRELLEETGYLAKNFIPIHPRPLNSGASGNISFGFIATNLEKITDAPEGDDTEDIEVVEVNMNQLIEFYLNLPADTYFDLGIIAAHAIALHQNIQG